MCTIPKNDGETVKPVVAFRSNIVHSVARTEGHRNRNAHVPSPTQLAVFSLCVQLCELESWPQLFCMLAFHICFNSLRPSGNKPSALTVSNAALFYLVVLHGSHCKQH
jgi:hypothetical protein